jgi:hypothetical protein
MILISLGIDLAAATYSDLHIARRITEDYDIELSARQVKRIRLRNSWLRRHNNPASNEAQDQETSTFDAVEQLLAEGRIRQYGYRHLIIHLARKYGHRTRALYVRYALKLLDDYGGHLQDTRNEEETSGQLRGIRT